MSSLNKVEIIGRLGNDPEMRSLPNGEAVARFLLRLAKVGLIKLVAREKKKLNGIELFSMGV